MVVEQARVVQVQVAVVVVGQAWVEQAGVVQVRITVVVVEWARVDRVQLD